MHTLVSLFAATNADLPAAPSFWRAAIPSTFICALFAAVAAAFIGDFFAKRKQRAGTIAHNRDRPEDEQRAVPDIRSFKWVALIAGVAGSALIAATIWVAAAIYGSVYDTYNAQPRLEVASESDTPPDTLAVLAADRRSDVRSAVASNRSSGPEALAVLAEDPDREIRALVASNPSSGPATLAVLAADSDPLVRACVGANHATPPAVLATLGADRDVLVRVAVTRNPKRPPEALTAASITAN